MWEVFFELGCQPASQLPSLSLPGSPILLGNAIGGIPDPEPIIPDSGVWWAAVRRRGGGDNRGKARSDPFELTEVKLNAQTERARRERERRGPRTDARMDGGTCCYGMYEPVTRSIFTSNPSTTARARPSSPSVRHPSVAIILAVSDDANLYPSHSTPRPTERGVGLMCVTRLPTPYPLSSLAGRGDRAAEEKERMAKVKVRPSVSSIVCSLPRSPRPSRFGRDSEGR